MDEFFRLSLNGAMFVAAICLLRLLFKRRLPRTAFAVLWIAALFRLICPARIPFAVSIWRLFEGRGAEPEQVTGAFVFSEPMQGLEGARSSYTAFEAIWLFTAIALLTGVLALYLYGVREICKAERIETIEKRVYRCKTITTPKVCGFFHPRILLPENIAEDQIPYILAHEQIHVRRMDNLWKLLSLVAAAIHWFNPAAWILVVMLGRDLEVSCDEWAVRKLNREQRAGYALSLIAIAERPQSRSPLTSGFSQSPLEERIRCIMTSGKKSVIALFAAIAVILCTTAVFATDAPEQKSEAGKELKEIEISYTQNGDIETAEEMEKLTVSKYETYMEREITSMKQQVRDGKLSQENYNKTVKEMKDVLSGLKEGSVDVYKNADGNGIVTISSSKDSDVNVSYQLKEDKAAATITDD